VYIVIVGAGLLGFHIASLMAGEGHDVVIVEQSEATIETIHRQLDVKTILGGAVSPSVLDEAGVRNADIVIATTNNDEANVVVCFLAKQMGALRTVARVRNPEYSGYLIAPAKSPTVARRVVRPKSLGIDLIVNPEIVAAEEIERILSSLYVAPTEKFAEGRVQLTEFRADKEAVLDKPLRDIGFPQPCVVAAIVRAAETMMPSRNHVIKRGDRVYIVASKEDMDELGALFVQPRGKASSAVIVGGGRVGFHIAQRLEEGGVRVKIIEQSMRRCREISQRLKQTVVVQGEGSDYDTLVQEGVASADAFVAATERDELNILLGLLGKNLGISRILALVDKPGYISMAEAIGIDVAISPLQLTASRIARLSRLAEVVSVSLLAGEQVEAIELVAGETAAIANKPLGQVQLPAGAIVGPFIHEDIVFIPQSDSVIQPGDHVVMVCRTSVSPAVEKLF